MALRIASSMLLVKFARISAMAFACWAESTGTSQYVCAQISCTSCAPILTRIRFTLKAQRYQHSLFRAGPEGPPQRQPRQQAGLTGREEQAGRIISCIGRELRAPKQLGSVITALSYADIE